MNKLLLAAALGLVLSTISGCQPIQKYQDNDTIIDETRKCNAAGLSALLIKDAYGEHRVVCNPEAPVDCDSRKLGGSDFYE